MDATSLLVPTLHVEVEIKARQVMNVEVKKVRVLYPLPVIY